MGCATPQKDKEATPSLVAAGRIVVTVASTPPQRWAAQFELSGSPQSGALVLLSPLGNTLARASWKPNGAQLEQGHKIQTFADVNHLTQTLVGATVPISALFAWVKGQALQTEDWEADLSDLHNGRLTARKNHPPPAAELRLALEGLEQASQ